VTFDSQLILILAIAVVGVLLVGGLVVSSRRRSSERPLPPTTDRLKPGIDYAPGVGDDAADPVDTALRPVDTIALPDTLPDADFDVRARADNWAITSVIDAKRSSGRFATILR